MPCQAARHLMEAIQIQMPLRPPTLTILDHLIPLIRPLPYHHRSLHRNLQCNSFTELLEASVTLCCLLSLESYRGISSWITKATAQSCSSGIRVSFEMDASLRHFYLRVGRASCNLGQRREETPSWIKRKE